MDDKKKLAEAVTSNGQQNQGFEPIQDHSSTNPARTQVSIDTTRTGKLTHKLFDRSGKRCIATIHGVTLFQKRRASTSIYRRLNSWNIGTHILDRARQLDAANVRIEDPETHKVYETELENFWIHGVEVYHVEAQRALPLRFWTVTGGNHDT